VNKSPLSYLVTVIAAATMNDSESQRRWVTNSDRVSEIQLSTSWQQ